MNRIMALIISTCFILPTTSWALNIEKRWGDAKDTMDDEVYMDHRITLYCGCEYISKNNNSGGGSMTAESCQITNKPGPSQSSVRIEWEHIVPASLMPARNFSCWTNKNQHEECDGSGRNCCEKISFTAQSMIFDLHNVAPSYGEINQYRKNGRYGIVENPDDQWEGCDIKDTGETQNGASHLFEPADCNKGDVARVWLYMHERHGVIISDEELAMFNEWSANDPVSPWEKTRHDRIAAIQGNVNPFVADKEPNASGSCLWEQ